MKKIFTLLAVTAATMIFVACDKEEKSNHSGGYTSISGVIQRMPTDADKYILKAIIESNTTDLTVATCAVAANGSFSLALPATVSDTYLYPFNEDIDVPLTVSNPNAKIGTLYLELYEDVADSDDDIYVDDIAYATLSVSPTSVTIYQATPSYSNSPFTATGNASEDGMAISVNTTFIKGWNWIVASANRNLATKTATATVTSKLPGGLQWHLESELSDIF